MSQIQSIVFYFSVFLVLFLFSYLMTRKETRSKRVVVFLVSFLILTFVAGFRAETVGSDTLQYVTVYSDFSTARFPFPTIRFEKGFSLFCYLCYKINPDPRTLIFFSSLVMNLFFLIFIFNNTKDITFGITAYCLVFFLMNLSAMRQGLGLAIVLLFYPCLKNRKYVLYLFGCILGALFHKITMIMAILIITPLFRKTLTPSIFLICLTMIATLFLKPVLIKIISMTSFSYYIDSEFFQGATFGGIYNMMVPAMCLLLIFPSFDKAPQYSTTTLSDGSLIIRAPENPKEIYYISSETLNESQMVEIRSPSYRKTEMDNKSTLISLVFAECLAILSISFSIFGRVYIEFLPFGVFLIPNLIPERKDKKACLLLGMAIWLLAAALLRPEWIGVYHYSFHF